MIENSDKYFSENTTEFIEFVERVRDASTNTLDKLEKFSEPDEENLSFLYSCFNSLT